MKTISVVTPCYNEEDNVQQVYDRVRQAILSAGYVYEHIFIDNASKDRTVEVLKEIASKDSNVKIIVNTRNFGHVRSPIHALYQTTGDAVIGIVADLQDPPELIIDMIRAWEKGFPVVICVKKTSREHGLMFWLRTKYYELVNRLSSLETYENFTGFGLYDRKVIDTIKSWGDPYPYFRGMIAEIGLPRVEIPYDQPTRKRGITKNNIYTLYDVAMLGITSLSKVPLRFVTFAGFVGSLFSVLAAFAYLIYKLLYWNRFEVGIAPVVIGIFFLGSIQFLFMGIIGEYIGFIHTQVQNRPLVIEKERVNFEHGPGRPLAASPFVASDVQNEAEIKK